MKKLILLAALPIVFISCNDTKLAQQLERAWTGGYNMSYDDGSKERVTETLLFSYNKTAMMTTAPLQNF